MSVGAHLTFCFSLIWGPMVLPQSACLQKLPQRHAQRYVLDDSRSCQVDNRHRPSQGGRLSSSLSCHSPWDPTPPSPPSDCQGSASQSYTVPARADP